MSRSILRFVGSYFLAAMIAACDGSLATKGHVYASANADSSRIYIDEPFPTVDGLVRIDSAVVWVFHRPADQTFDTTLHITRSERTLSGQCGSFSTAASASPWPFEALIEVQRAGFKNAMRRFRNDSIAPHRVIVVLAPIPGSVFPPPAPVIPCA
jgi:hypothetical protein